MLKAVAFDLDGTLAESKSKISENMACKLYNLCSNYSVIIITGGKFDQIVEQLLKPMGLTGDCKGIDLNIDVILSRLHLLPTSGSVYMRYMGDKWGKVYEYQLTPEEKLSIYLAFDYIYDKYGKPDRVWGDPIEDRGSQITLSWLGQEAPTHEKKKWDPLMEKRKKIVEELSRMLPKLEVRAGGTTSIDVTQKGMDKSFGISKIMDYLNLEKSEIIFIGDALYDGGNDYPVTKLGIKCIPVFNTSDTLRLINCILEGGVGEVAF